jgi:chromosome segregation ATPase
MSRTDEVFKPAISGRKIPVLTLDNKWHRLFQKAEPDRELKRLENELNELLKKQGKANTEIKELKKLKKKLMDEIVQLADEAANGKDKQVEKKLEENKRLINECNEKTEECEDALIDLPREIESVNRELMLKTMEICYDTLKSNKAEIEETSKWIANVRVELKKKLIRKQEQEQQSQDIYTYMHNIFGPDVIDVFDLEFENQENQEKGK